MDFHVGDPVIHRTYGLGEIVGMEERALSSQMTLYYVVQIRDLTIFVPVNSQAMNPLRSPTPERDFKELFIILSEPGESLSDDRFERKTQLRKKLYGGKAEATCQVIRDLSSYQHKKPLNDEDKLILKQANNSLLGEWGYSLSIPLAQVEIELDRLLRHTSEDTATE